MAGADQLVRASAVLEYRQFGVMQDGVQYPVRPGAHGIALNESGLVAVVRIGAAKGAPEYDLPGGGVDPGETSEQAMVREFMEETGLPVRPGRLIAQVGQYWRKDNVRPRNSQFSIFEAFVDGPPLAPKEPNHLLVWVAPKEAMSMVRHEAHAWALRGYFSG